MTDLLSPAIALPPTLSEFARALPIVAGGGYWMTVIEVSRAVEVRDPITDEITLSWNRGFHADWIFWAVEPRTRTELMNIMRDLRSSAVARGIVTVDVDHDTPTDMRLHFAELSHRKVWRHISTGVAFFLGESIKHPSHLIAGEGA